VENKFTMQILDQIFCSASLRLCAIYLMFFGGGYTFSFYLL
jgi:hypothetical protein